MINSILLTDFTGFANTRFDFTKGINVLIGKNGTGKTHVLKCLAATLQARHDFLGKNSASKEQFEYILAEDMIFYFKPDVIGNLVNKGVPSGRAIQLFIRFQNNCKIRNGRKVGRSPLYLYSPT